MERVGRGELISVLLPSLSNCVGRFGHVFLWDSGSSVGDIMGHSKFINSIDYRQTRPFRVATAGEDTLVCWFEGPPFRYKQSIKVSPAIEVVARTRFMCVEACC